MSPIDGKPFVWDWGFQNRIPVDLSTYNVPDEFICYMEARDGAYYIYAEDYRVGDHHEAQADIFFQNFPEWEDIAPKVAEGDYGWTEEDHNKFRAAAAWFAERPGFFWVWPF